MRCVTSISYTGLRVAKYWIPSIASPWGRLFITGPVIDWIVFLTMHQHFDWRLLKPDKITEEDIFDKSSVGRRHSFLFIGIVLKSMAYSHWFSEKRHKTCSSLNRSLLKLCIPFIFLNCVSCIFVLFLCNWFFFVRFSYLCLLFLFLCKSITFFDLFFRLLI
jgi:hypothetical protein